MENINQLQQADSKSGNDLKESSKQEQDSSQLDRHKWERHKWYRVKSNDPDGIKSRNVIIIQATGVRSMYGQELLEKLDPEEVERLEVAEKLFINELELSSEKKYTLTNLTSERITIRNYYATDKNLFVPGFGSRNLNGKELLDLDYLGWESQGLIKISEETDKQKVRSSIAGSVIGLTLILLFFFLIVSIPLALQGSTLISWQGIGIVTLITLVAVGTMLVIASRYNNEFAESMRNWVTLLPGIILTLATGVGLPVLIIYVYGDALHGLIGTPPGTGSLGRFLQIALISIASILPAFLFYLFGRQQADKQRENFYREAMLLDPNVWSYNESKNKYGPLLDTVNDTGNSPLSIILLVTSTALLVLGWMITLAPLGQPSDSFRLFDFFAPNKESILTFGFLGAYFFTINLVYRRYVRADLTPKTYAYITMRLITTFVLVWAVSLLPFTTGMAGLSAIAFTIGIFPESALTLIQDYVNKLTARRRGQYQEQYSLKKLEGMNLYDQARLMEEGIENIENLAHHNLMELIVRTRIPTARLVDMFDQAILYLHLGLEDEEDDSGTKKELTENPAEPDNRKLLKSLGIRTASDLLSSRDEITAFQGDQSHTTFLNKLDIIISALEDDEWLNYILSWRENSSTRYNETIDNPYKFYAIVSERVASLPRKRKRSMDKPGAPVDPKALEKPQTDSPETAPAGA